MPARRKIIISIDGGGIRGIIPLIILRKLFEGQPSPAQDYPIEWWGTSAGALIGTSVEFARINGFDYYDGIQKTLDFFEFRSSNMLEENEALISNRPFKTLLESLFSNTPLNQLPQVNIVATDAQSGNAINFTKSNTSLVSALRASCSVPGIFPPVEINGKLYIDGFLSAKNPSHLAFLANEMEENILFISLGTGVLHVNDEIEDAVKAVEDKMKILSVNNAFHYYRLNPTLNLASDDLQNNSAKNIFNLKEDAYQFLRDHSKEIDQLRSVLYA